ncbi:MAG TPA: hypothetical protein VNY30_13490, partial [Bryobacteraceae bacterium]|nr:hypothetical protein [Bryobacteraceae bacterium]
HPGFSFAIRTTNLWVANCYFAILARPEMASARMPLRSVTMEKVMGFGVLPIANENDTVSTAELETVSDNSPSAAFSDK